MIVRRSLGSSLLAIILASAGAAAPPTFTEDVRPILDRSCVSCHRPGEVAPMSLMSYEEARPWAKSIRRAVAEREMPPWSAAADVGRFRNDRRLSDAEVDTLVRWVDAGAPRGPVPETAATGAADQASIAETGWAIGAPDLVVSFPEPFVVPASGVVDYVYARIPTNLTEGRWVRAIEVRPGAREVIHHVDVYACQPGCPGSEFLSSLEPGVPTRRPESPTTERPEPSTEAAVEGETRNFLTSFLPGGRPLVFPEGYAQWLPAGADLVLNIHYTPAGIETPDRTEVGLVFTSRPERRVVSYFLDNYSLWIPAGEPRHAVDSVATLAREAELLALTPHMHFRGIAAEVAVVDPDEEPEPVLSVPRYDFDWQITYELEEPRRLTAGTEIRYRLVWDNSTANLANPDAARDVPWGQQTSDEMASLFVTLAVPTAVEPNQVFDD